MLAAGPRAQISPTRSRHPATLLLFKCQQSRSYLSLLLSRSPKVLIHRVQPLPNSPSPPSPSETRSTDGKKTSTVSLTGCTPYFSTPKGPLSQPSNSYATQKPASLSLPITPASTLSSRTKHREIARGSHVLHPSRRRSITFSSSILTAFVQYIPPHKRNQRGATSIVAWPLHPDTATCRFYDPPQKILGTLQDHINSSNPQKHALHPNSSPKRRDRPARVARPPTIAIENIAIMIHYI
jgi:hypothetical protein